MRTSLKNIESIEDYLLERMEMQERLVFEARLLVNADLQENLEAQRKLYDLVRAYGRKRLRSEIEAIGYKLFTTAKYKRFQERVWRLFRKT